MRKSRDDRDLKARLLEALPELVFIDCPRLNMVRKERRRSFVAYGPRVGAATTLAVAKASVFFRISLLCSLLGLMAGIGGATFIYANGHSYLSTDPKACVNCHVMRPQFDGWQKSSHHTVAVCTDCHIPRGFFSKYYTKAENGYLHSKAFTLQNFLDPIQMRPSSLRIANDACLHCHSDMTSELLAHAEVEPSELNFCTRCHQDVGH